VQRILVALKIPALVGVKAEQGLVNPSWQLLGEERFDLVAPKVQQPIEAKVQVGQVEPQEIPEKSPKSLEWGHRIILPVAQA
jgi:hypothetical protein